MRTETPTTTARETLMTATLHATPFDGEIRRHLADHATTAREAA